MRTIEGNTIRLKHRSGKGVLVTAQFVTLIAVAAAAGLAQDHSADVRPKSEELEGPQGNLRGVVRLRRLESVTWNPVAEELTWVLSAGTRSAGVYQPGKTETYVIHLESATMTYKDEARRFSEAEAGSVHELMDFISRYVVESTIWWEAGKDEKLYEKKNSASDQKQEDKENPFQRRGRTPIASVSPSIPMMPDACVSRDPGGAGLGQSVAIPRISRAN